MKTEADATRLYTAESRPAVRPRELGSLYSQVEKRIDNHIAKDIYVIPIIC